MRNYNYEDKWQKLLTPEIVESLTMIHEYKGQQHLIASRHADVLADLAELALVRSIESSNKIEGIYTSDERLKKIVMDKTMPKTRDECEIAGYRDVLHTIHESYEHIPVKSAFILQLHRNLYKFEDIRTGGSFKSTDNVIEGQDTFHPVAAWETSESVERLCAAYENAVNRTNADHLLLIPMFILDFLCIHPFQNGNGRMSRLLTLLLLYKSGYYVGKYISIERLIEKTKDSYYDTLQESSRNWHEESNDYAPFVKYMLGIVVAVYRDFMESTKLIEEKRISKPDRIADAIKNHIGTITKAELLKIVPDVSQTTVQRALTDLVKQEKIHKIGNGRYTKYTWNWDA